MFIQIKRKEEMLKKIDDKSMGKGIEADKENEDHTKQKAWEGVAYL